MILCIHNIGIIIALIVFVVLFVIIYITDFIEINFRRKNKEQYKI